MARSAADASILLGVIAGQDPADPTAAFATDPDYLAELEAGLGDLRIGIDRRWVSDDVDGATVNALYTVAEVLRDLGGVVVDTVFPDPTQIVLDWFTACAVQTAVAHEATYPARKSEYGPALSLWVALRPRHRHTRTQGMSSANNA
jgi:amidase